MVVVVVVLWMVSVPVVVMVIVVLLPLEIFARITAFAPKPACVAMSPVVKTFVSLNLAVVRIRPYSA